MWRVLPSSTQGAGGERVEVADVLGLLDRVAGGLDPDVLAPHLRVARSADQVPGQAPVTQRGRAGSAVRAPGELDLHARGGGVLVALREERLGLPMARVTGGEERRRVLQMLVAERDDLGRAHRT